jgi:hypothetical protein
MAYAAARLAWRDVQRGRARVSGMRKDAFDRSRAAVGWVAGVAVLVVVAVAWGAAGMPGSERACPSGSTSVSTGAPRGSTGAPRASTGAPRASTGAPRGSTGAPPVRRVAPTPSASNCPRRP